MDVVGHYNPIMQNIPAFVKVSHGRDNEISYIWPPQMTAACTTVQMTLKRTIKIARNSFFRIINFFSARREAFEAPQALRFFSLQFQQ